MKVTLRSVSKRFGSVVAVDDVSLDIENGELFFLLGPSGCGKTTVLRLIAGFYAPDAGEILFDGRPVHGVPPHQRNTGMVFQNYALWPHMTVAQNVAYGLDVRGLPRAEKKRRVREALEIVRMSEHADRSPAQLSGGQQQRVALARALVIQPGILLLDEPLSNLDAKLRLETREEITRIHEETRLTMLYVTHDQKEALSMADRIGVMNAGRLAQVGTPHEIYRTPNSRFVADFIGEMNFIAGRVAQCAGGLVTVATDCGHLTAVETRPFQVGDAVLCGIRPEALTPALVGTESNLICAVVERATYLGEVQQYRLKLADGQPLRALETNPEVVREPGDSLTLTARPQDIVLFEP
ncbi:MAG: ABC transporter ATP-binding protein [Verrucomicrobiae bacterium]|nr:ABC transporter ATP-binding protein [Verrucomicrobiae bacterium]